MRYFGLAIATALAALCLLCIGWAQQTQDTQPSGTSSAASANPSGVGSQGSNPSDTVEPNQKPKHWSGSLVDIPCMAKELSTGNGAQGNGTDAETPNSALTPAPPHFMNEASQTPGGQTGPGQAPATSQTPQTFPAPTESPNPAMSPADQARAARANRVDSIAKQCSATQTTQDFRLAVGDGQVLRFDQEGNAKASDALKGVELRPGKKLKAKVSGRLGNGGTTVEVASIEVKAKRASPASSPASSPGL